MFAVCVFLDVCVNKNRRGARKKRRKNAGTERNRQKKKKARVSTGSRKN